MPFAAFADQLRPGSRDDVLAALAHFAADPPTTQTFASTPRWLSTAVFVRESALVWVVQCAPTVTDPAAALADLPETVAMEGALAPFLAEGGRPNGLAAVFARRAMRPVQQRVVRHQPGARLDALWYAIRPGCEQHIAAAFDNVRPEVRPVLRDAAGATTGALHGVAVFVKGAAMVRVVAYDGDVLDVARYMAARPARPGIERLLAPFLAEPEDTTSEEAFLRAFPHRLMHPAAPLRLAG